MFYRDLPLRYNKKTHRWHDKENKYKITNATCDCRCQTTGKCMVGISDKENCEKNQEMTSKLLARYNTCMDGSCNGQIEFSICAEMQKTGKCK